MKIQVIKGDITQQSVDVIVNAANSSLLGGGGVDGAIHRAGGIEVLEDCRRIRAKQGGCKTGEAIITKAGKLACKAIIHTVGPVYNDGGADKEKLLSNCYLNSLMLAEKHHYRSIAFPNISTGIYRFPKQKAAKIAIETVKRYRPIKELEQVVFVCFDEGNYQLYQEILK